MNAVWPGCARGNTDSGFEPAPVGQAALEWDASDTGSVTAESASSAYVAATAERPPSAEGAATVEGSPTDEMATTGSAPLADGMATVEGTPANGMALPGDGAVESTMSEGRPSSAGDEASPGSDDGGPPSNVEDAGSLPPPRPSLGELLITEVMFEPSGPKPASDWFEVYNAATSPRSLSGLVIQDGYSRVHVITPDVAVLIPQQGYALLVRNRVTALANGLPAEAIAYEYGIDLAPDSGIQLDDDPNGAISLWNGGVELANVPYGAWVIPAISQSIELGLLQLVGSDTPESWCFAQNPWTAGSDYGTPGFPNDCP